MHHPPLQERGRWAARRSYVRLRPDNPLLAALDLVPRLEDDLRGRRRVVFVCTQNSARSQLAASAWRHVSSLPATSAGTHPAGRVHPGAVRVARRHGVPLEDQQTRHVDDVVTPDDLVIAVCDAVHEEVPNDPRLHWSVPDPCASAEPGDFEAAFDDIVHRVHRVLELLVRVELLHPNSRADPRRCRRPAVRTEDSAPEADIDGIGLRSDRDLNLVHACAVGDGPMRPRSRRHCPRKVDVRLLQSEHTATQPDAETVVGDRQQGSDPWRPGTCATASASCVNGDVGARGALASAVTPDPARASVG